MAYNMGEAVGYINLNIDGFKKGFNDVQAQAAQLDNISNSISKSFDIAAKAIIASFAAITAASAAAIKQTLAAGAAFEASMSQVAATMGMTAEEISNNSQAYVDLENAAKEMGATTKFSATQAAEALNYLALAGYSVEESISTLPTILNVAAAGGMDLAAASDMVTDAMSALGLSVDEAASFTDKLAKTSQKSNTNIAQLGAGILQIGGTAKSLAGGVDELATALGILANNGIKAAEGGTALRQIVLNLTAPTEKAAKYMESLGFSAYDAAGNMKPLNQTFAELDEIMSQFSTQQEKDSVLTNIFDARQLKSARALLANYGESWDNLYDQISNSNGAAELMAQTMEQNLQGALTIAKSAIEAVQVTAYEGLQKGLTQAVETATTAITKLNTALSTPEAQEALNRVSEAEGDLIVKFAEFAANVIPKVISVLGNLDEIANSVKSALIGMGIALAGVTSGLLLGTEAAVAHTVALVNEKIAALAANAALLANPYTAVAAAIGVIISATVNYYSELKRVTDLAHETVTEYSEMADAAHRLADAYTSTTYAAEEKAGATIEEINNIRTLANELIALAKQEELTDEQLLRAQDIISELNKLYPENTVQIVDGQIVAYEGLAQAVYDYTDALYLQSQMELAATRSDTAKTAMEETEKAMEGQAAACNELRDEYDKAIRAREYYEQGGLFSQNYTMTAKKEAKEMGMTLKEYYYYQEELAAAAYKDAVDAYSENEDLWQKANKDYKQAVEERIEISKQLNEANMWGATVDLQNAIRQDKALRDTSVNAAKQEAEEKKKIVEQTWIDISTLDREYSLGRIATEEDYQEKRKALLESIRNETDDDWIKEYSKSVTYDRQQADKALREEEQRQKEAQRQQEEAEKQRQQELEDYIEGQWNSFERRHKTDVSYTEKMMIDDMKKSLEILEKDSDLYKQLSERASDKEADYIEDLRKEREKAAEKNFDVWAKSYDEITDKAEKSFADVKKSQDDLADSLLKSVNLYETKSTEVWNKEKQQWEKKEEKVASSIAIKNQTKELTKYMEILDELQGKGLSENVMAQILGMSAEDGAEFAEQLNKMTESELQAYGAAYDGFVERANQYSADFYQPQMEAVKNQYNADLEEWKKQVPIDWQLVGEETISGFIQGVEEKAADSENAANAVISASLDSIKQALGIQGGTASAEMVEAGGKTIQSIIDGAADMAEKLKDKFSAIGENSAEKYIQGFRSVWENFVNNSGGLINAVKASNSISDSLAYPPLPVNWGGASGAKKSVSESYSGGAYSISRSDIESAIRAAMPSGDVVIKIEGSEFARIARTSLNGEGLNSGRVVLKN